MPSPEQIEKLLASDPNDPFLLYGLAQEFARQGRWADAVASYDRCLAADPAYCYAYYHKGKAQESAGDHAAALTTLRAGLKASRTAGDPHASSEIQSLLDELEP